jgi:putative tricarboxylic transport membrane protein
MAGVFRRQDVLGGLLLAACGMLGLVLGRSLSIGTARRMGPGFFPSVLSWLLILLGIGIAGAGALRAGTPASGVTWRPLILVTAAVIVFSVLIDRAGLLVATAAVVSVAAFAGRDARWPEVATLAVGMAVCAVALFIYALGLPVPLWGR